MLCIMRVFLKTTSISLLLRQEDGGEIGGSRVHFPSMPVKYLADLRSRAEGTANGIPAYMKIGDQR